MLWNACVRDAGERIGFLVRIVNDGDTAAELSVRLSWFHASSGFSPCPAPWGDGARVVVPAGATVATDSGCAADKEPVNFQTRANVVRPGRTWGYRAMSPGAHVHSDGSVEFS
ncbi:hypothetical protein EKD16_13720 [Streptomonospora litoralis]|uniref:Uncharacterized protein n=1 Tax=Streptomonospora litoralis TaxID=2498135 RepID=A0A4P6Q1L5_9ACTN|nr:hypothetical protein EKD16_13720 [Streptomonospora litoralis]